MKTIATRFDFAVQLTWLCEFLDRLFDPGFGLEMVMMSSRWYIGGSWIVVVSNRFRIEK